MDDVRNALRQWGRTPAVTALAVLSLTLGLGSTIALFSLADALLLRTLPIAEAHELTRIVGRDFKEGEQHDIGVPTHVWDYMREHQTIFASVLAVGTDRVNLARGGETRYVGCAYVSPEYFDTLGVRIAHGRAFDASDQLPANAAVAIISHSLWQREYAEGEVLGQAIYLDGQRFTIVGVAPRDFFGLEVGRVDDVIMPLAAQDIVRGADSQLRRPESSWLQVYGRLRDANGFDATRAALAAWYPAIRDATTAGVSLERHLPYPFDLVSAAQGRSFLRGQYGDALRLLLLVVTVLLMIAAINLAMLGTARLTDRRHEIGVRLALGASRARIARMLVTDSLLLAAVSGIAALWLGHALAAVAAQLLTVNRFAFIETTLLLTLDTRLVLVAIGITVSSALVAGLLPAWRAARVTPLDGMREQVRGHHGAGTLRVMRTLAGGQIALAVTLVVCASLLVRSFVQLITRPTGVDADRVLVVVVNDPLQSPHRSELLQRIERTRAALTTVPGVTAVSAGLITPLSGLMAAARMQIPGSQAVPTGGASPFNFVLPGYFDVLGTPLLMGRDFTVMDVAAGPGGGRSVAVVNQAFAQRHYGGSNPIGRTLLLGDREVDIVGVVANTRAMTLRENGDVAMAYSPVAQRQSLSSANLRWVLRTDTPEHVQHGVALALRAVDPRIGVEFKTMNDEALSTINRERLLAWLGGLFAALGLVIALIGIYGTFAYAVTRRRAEIGVRLALGAQRRQIVMQFLREAAVVVGVGLIVGVLAARAGAQWLQSLLFGLSAHDLATTVAACTAVIIAAAAATYIPARRAASTDPTATLRDQ